MAYDEDLAERIRACIAPESRFTEKPMFGGLAFLVGGNMAIAASGQGGVLVRVDPDESDKLVRTTKASVAVMRGRPMAGWLRVAPKDVRTDRQLAKWVRLGTAAAAALPAKGATRKRSGTAASGNPKNAKGAAKKGGGTAARGAAKRSAGRRS